MNRLAIWRRSARQRRTALLVLGVIWLGLLLGAAIPAWRKAALRHREILTLDEQLAELDRWSVAGLWLERSLRENAPAVDRAWSTLFPERRDRETLFLDLAGIADRSGVADFDLVELDEPRMEKDHQWLTRAPLPAAGADQDEVRLGFYRVRASFLGGFEQVADFLGGLKQFERAVSVHSLTLETDRQWVRVDLELDVYVKQPSQT